MVNAVERQLAIARERRARDAVLTAKELTTDELDAFDAAKSRREALGISESEVGDWGIEQDRSRGR